jgi:hypothetical protein
MYADAVPPCASVARMVIIQAPLPYMDPNFPWAHRDLGMVYEQKKMYAEAIAEFKKTHRTESKPIWGYGARTRLRSSRDER